MKCGHTSRIDMNVKRTELYCLSIYYKILPNAKHRFAVVVTIIIMAFDFSGKKILVTGAGGGIGRELVKAIVNAKGEVYALGRTKENIESLANEVSNVHPILADLSDWEASRKVLEELGTMDGVVNNAAVFCSSGEALSMKKEILIETLNVNLMGAINVTQVTAKKMIDSGKKVPSSMYQGNNILVSKRNAYFLNAW